MKRIKNNPVMLFPFLDHIISDLMQSGRIGTANNYRAASRSFNRFRKGEDLSLPDLDSATVEDYETYLKQRGLTNNTISFYMRVLRAVYYRACSKTGGSNDNPFATVFTGNEKTRKRAIPFQKIRDLYRLDLSVKPELEFARDIFMFLFMCRGMSFIDAAYLRKTDVSHGILTYQRHKTRQQLQVRIVPHLRAIIDKYHRIDSPFLLPIITKEGVSERRQYETALRKINNYLKKIAEKVGISVPLSTYVARHSWATIAKSRNIPVNVISDALGHESVITTQIYLDSIDNDIIDRANDLVIRGL